jgi:hypothetical protein
MIIGSDVESDPLPVQPEGRRHFPPRAAFHLIRHRPALNHAPGSRTDCQIAGPAQVQSIRAVDRDPDRAGTDTGSEHQIVFETMPAAAVNHVDPVQHAGKANLLP